MVDAKENDDLLKDLDAIESENKAKNAEGSGQAGDGGCQFAEDEKLTDNKPAEGRKRRAPLRKGASLEL